VTTLTRELARLVRARDIEPRHLSDASRYVLDWTGCLAAGGATQPGIMLRGYALHRDDTESRAFLAGALSHITETDDLHRASITHPGCAVIPAAFAVGHRIGANGADVLRAIIVGYEVMLRIGEALGPAHYRIFHNTATAGVFGSAAAAAKLLKLDEDQWVWALGNAGTQASGLWQFNRDATMSKHLHAGHAAESGVRAALLAAQGFTGAAAILEGEQGFFRGFCPDAKPEAVLAEASDWKFGETSLKPYPSCRHTHPAIDCALRIREVLQQQNGLGEIASVHIGSYSAALLLTDSPQPATEYAAKFSMQYCVATALLRGSPTLSDFGDAARNNDKHLVKVLGQSTVANDPELNAAYPTNWGAEVTVKTATGLVFKRRVTGARGDPENPLSDEEVSSKVAALCAFGGLDGTRTARLLAECHAMAGGAIPELPWLDS
jgi:2-methylcitrate dehydratase PrpD